MSKVRTQERIPEQQAPPAQELAAPVYDVKIHAIHMEGPVLADASATLNGVFAIRGIRVVRGEDGPFVAMPRFKSSGESRDVCAPKTKEGYEDFKEAVLDAYRQTAVHMRMGGGQAEQQEAPAREQLPTSVDVKINTLRMEGPMLADATVELAGAFTVRGVRVVNSDKGLFASMPRYKSGEEYKDVCFPCTKEFHEQFQQAVLDGYQQTLKQAFEQAEAPAQDQAGPVMSM